MAAANAVHTCRLCLGIHIPHALGVGIGHVLIMLHVRYVVGRSLDQWQHYCRKRAYAERSKSSSRHVGDPIDTASNPPLSPTSTRSVSPPPPSLPLPLPSEGSGEGSEAPSVTNINAVNVDEPRVPSPTSMPSREHGERGRDTPQVGDGEGEAASTSLASAGGEGGVSPASAGPLR